MDAVTAAGAGILVVDACALLLLDEAADCSSSDECTNSASAWTPPGDAACDDARCTGGLEGRAAAPRDRRVSVVVSTGGAGAVIGASRDAQFCDVGRVMDSGMMLTDEET